MTFPIIDLFAGPGGLGEGFSSFTSDKGIAFKIKLSIEKDEFAHQTLQLRACYRQFSPNNAPADYYQYLRGEIKKEELFQKYPDKSYNAQKEAWLAELGETDRSLVKSRIVDALNGASDSTMAGPPGP